MSSILTNTSAMVALQTLRGVNSNLSMVQSEISTGKSVGTARDNASIWSISKVMESDVKGFKGISESLSLGQSTVSVARNAAETVTDLLTEMKGKIVSAQEENVDRAKIQDDIDALSGQIQSITGAAQFNGLNMLSGQDDVNILSSLDRAADGSVTASDITVRRNDLTFDAGVMGTGANLAGGAAITAGDAAVVGGNLTIRANAGQVADASSTRDFSNTGNSMEITMATAPAIGEQYNLQIGDTTVSFTTSTVVLNDLSAGLSNAINGAGIEGVTASVTGAAITITSTSKFDDLSISGSSVGGTSTFSGRVDGAAASAAAATLAPQTLEARASELTFSTTANVAEGDGYRVSIGGTNYDYVAGKNETMEDVAKGLKVAIDGASSEEVSTRVIQDATSGAWILQVDNDGAALALTADGFAGGEATGGLAGVDTVDVTTDVGVEAALANVETWIDTAIESAASFGSAQGRIDTQSDFVTSMMDSLKTGIGALVDADMEEASAKLQALQVQQQLSIQSLSIANQAPQSILSLFR